MSDLTVGILSALLATNQPQAVSNFVQQQTGVSVPITNPNDPEEKELHQIMIDDDAAMDEVNSWMATNNISMTNTEAKIQLNKKIVSRLNIVRDEYITFLRNNPDSARGYLAYGSFLNDIGDEDGAEVQYLNSKQLDPKNPAAWNDLANYYGEHGELTNAFADYEEAIRLDPKEPVYYQNFATTVYLYRKDVREYYHINEAQVFDKSLALYQAAMSLDPSNIVLATDYAESYYGIKPLRTNDALVAWSNALNIARDDNEREGVKVHLARVKIAAGMYDNAQSDLNSLTNPAFADMKTRLTKSMANHKNPPPDTTVDSLSDEAVTYTPPTKLSPAGNGSVPIASTNLTRIPPNSLVNSTNPIIH